ncbi:homocysteine S-methyltransferase family protein [Umezawaea endophytica]|uniref:Uncharacterized protein n=1 Tax=Umezawaea endophytica TaxID=1654476 RepID=A0A9X3A516_9PSEU|nr:homocysteine S-methyltransferase family protein [Umezawaea endophytica]MCS7483359.1 hypothetical protein [Umezawaea endophytica]
MADRVSSPVAAAFEDRVVGAGGTTDAALPPVRVLREDFAGHSGCRELLNATRPDVGRGVRRACPEAGPDSVETNTFGSDPPNPADRGTSDRIFEPSGAGPTDQPTDAFAAHHPEAKYSHA